MQKYFAIARKVSWLKPYRKELQIKSIYYFESWVREAARRTSIPLELFRFLTIEEMNDALQGKEFSMQLLQSRRQSSVCLIDKGKQFIYVGEEAEKIRSQIERLEIDMSISELHGTPAMTGKGRGRARVVNVAEDMAKMQQGDVLVSVATNPALLPAMKKASAIVTNMGGLTCHAAIVSRELGIPCVIGTKIATKWLKDGDEIEVDANTGVVRRL